MRVPYDALVLPRYLFTGGDLRHFRHIAEQVHDWQTIAIVNAEIARRIHLSIMDGQEMAATHRKRSNSHGDDERRSDC